MGHRFTEQNESRQGRQKVSIFAEFASARKAYKCNILSSLAGLGFAVDLQPTVKTVGYYLSSLSGLLQRRHAEQ